MNDENKRYVMLFYAYCLLALPSLLVILPWQLARGVVKRQWPRQVTINELPGLVHR